jgi:hypothetical protein
MTDAEFAEWLSRFDARVAENDNLEFVFEAGAKHVLMASSPRNAVDLGALGSWLVHRSPLNRGRALWLRHWFTYPPDQEKLFERLKGTSGDDRSVGTTPAFLFEPRSRDDLEMRTALEVEEDSTLLGMILFVLIFDWQAYLLADGCSGYVYFADEHISFISTDRAEIDGLARELAGLQCEVDWIKTS